MTSLLAAAAAGVIAYHAWQSVHWLFLLLLIPSLMRLLPSRLSVWLMAFVYFLVFARDVPYAVSQFFPDWHPAVGYLVLILDAFVLSLPFLLFNPKASIRGRVIAATIIVTILYLPPIGLLAWGNPLFAAGALFPGLAWFGLLVTGVLFVSLVVIETKTARWITASVLVLALASNLAFEDKTMPGWIGVDTHLSGPFPSSPTDRASRAISLAAAARQGLKDASVVVLPESVAGPWRQGLERAFSEMVSENVLIGSQVPIAGGGYHNALVKPSGELVSSSRVPMPIGDWRPGAAQANIFGSDIAVLAGKKIAVSICFEDFILWPHRGLLRGSADLLVSSANDWSVAGRDAVVIQKTGAEALARMAGVPLVRAVNR